MTYTPGYSRTRRVLRNARARRYPPRAYFATALFPLLALGGCGARKDVPPPSATPAATASQAGKPRVATDASFTEAIGERLPGLPDFPEYPNAVLVGTAERNRPNAPKLGYRLQWATKDSVPMVMAWYQKTLQEKGWTYSPPTDGVTNSQIADISKGDLEGTVEAELEQGVTQIVVTLGPKKK
jgi:hypothetical protein